MAEITGVMEHRQKRVSALEVEYNNVDDKIREAEKILPQVPLMKDFWSIFKEVTVSSNQASGNSDVMELPLGKEALKNLRRMLDVLVEGFTVDKDNIVLIQFSIPVLESIHKDAESCRQLLVSPYQREKLETNN